MSHSVSPSDHKDHPVLHVHGTWETVFQDEPRAALEQLLPGYIAPRRWFGSKARTIESARLIEIIPITPLSYLTLVKISFTTGELETYVLPLAFVAGEQAEVLRRERPMAVIAVLRTAEAEGVLYDAVWNPRFDAILLEMIGEGKQFTGSSGDIVASATSVFARLRGDTSHALTPHVLGVEQSNTNMRFGEHLLLKLYRRLEAGVNPDLEIGQFLTERVAFEHIPPVAGAIEYRRRQDPASGEPITLAILQGFVRNQGDAWYYTLDGLREYFARMRSLEYAPTDADLPEELLLELIKRPLPAQAEECIGAYLRSSRLLGQRTAELHVALASDSTDPAFAPERFTIAFQRSLHKSMHSLTTRIMQLLWGRFDSLPESARPDARRVLDLETEIASRFDTLLGPTFSALRTRIHGDYHLGQVLYTGSDFMIIDFEGEPARPLAERRQKRSALQDVAGMLRSFHYAAYAAFFEQITGGAQPSDVETFTQYWHRWVSVAYLQSYMQIARSAAFLPQSDAELKTLLDAYLLEKAVYELGYELNNRPDWVKIPLQGILQTLQAV